MLPSAQASSSSANLKDMKALEAAVFKSASPRFKGAQRPSGMGRIRKPGPADYDPAKADGRSFHLNLARRWV